MASWIDVEVGLSLRLDQTWRVISELLHPERIVTRGMTVRSYIARGVDRIILNFLVQVDDATLSVVKSLLVKSENYLDAIFSENPWQPDVLVADTRLQRRARGSDVYARCAQTSEDAWMVRFGLPPREQEIRCRCASHFRKVAADLPMLKEVLPACLQRLAEPSKAHQWAKRYLRSMFLLSRQ